MAMYQMDTSLNAIGEIKRVLQAAGLITEIYYETTSWLIFSTSRSDKVVKISSSMALYVGDVWTSGTTVTNELSICTPYGGSWPQGGTAWFIVTPDVACYTVAHPTSNSYCAFWTFSKLDNGDFIILASYSNSTDTGSQYARWFNSTDNEQYSPVFAPLGLMTDASNYYNTFDMPFRTAGTNLYRPGVLLGAKFLFKAPSLNESAQIFNPDVVVSFRFMKNTQQLDFQCCLLIVNGNV